MSDHNTEVRRGRPGENREANLIIHHGIADVLDQAAELVHIPGGVQEACDLASLFKRDELLKNIFQFPDRRQTSGQVSSL